MIRRCLQHRNDLVARRDPREDRLGDSIEPEENLVNPLKQQKGNPVPQPNPDYIRELVEIVNASPFPEHMHMRLSSIGLDQAVLELRMARCHLQAYGIVHGGVLATLIDTATFWSVYFRIPEDAGLVNVDLKLNYLKAVEKGVLTAEGRAIRTGNTICYAESEVYNDNRDLVAHGTSTLMIIPGKGLKMRAQKFLEGQGCDTGRVGRVPHGATGKR